MTASRSTGRRLGIAVGARARRRPLEQQRALGEHQLDVDAGLDLDRRVVRPRAVRVRPALDAERPVAGARRHQARLEPVEPGRDVDHPGARAVDPGRVGEHRRRGDGVVPFAEHGGPHGHRLADDGLGREPPGLGDGGDVHDGDAADGGAAAARGESSRSRTYP